MKSNLELIAKATRAIISDREKHMEDYKTTLLSDLKDEIITQNITALAAIDQMTRVLRWFNEVNGRKTKIIPDDDSFKN